MVFRSLFALGCSNSLLFIMLLLFLQGTSVSQGWRSGESTCLPPMCPGFNFRTRRHMWVEFVASSRPCSEGLSADSPVFLPPQKSTLLNSNSIWQQWMKNHFVEMPLQIPIYFYFVFIKVSNCIKAKPGLEPLSLEFRLKISKKTSQGVGNQTKQNNET